MRRALGIWRRWRFLVGGVAILALVCGVAEARASATEQSGDSPPASARGSLGLAPVQQAVLLADSGAASDGFGMSVAVSGDTAVVGAPFADLPGAANAGKAYVFTRSGETWALQETLVADAPAPDDRFGHAVAVSGDTVLIGAPYDDTANGANSGSAWVFARAVGVWLAPQQLLAAGGAYEYFGDSVALSGRTAVVGAPLDDTVGMDAGAAYVFTRSAATWKREKLTSSDGDGAEGFGVSVAASGTSVLIGAPYDAAHLGAAYAFTRSSGKWVQRKLTAADGVAGDQFGYAVALSGDTALVGAHYDSTGAGFSAGSAWVFTRSGSIWDKGKQLTAGDGAANDKFGDAVAISGDLALVGVPGDSTAAGDYAGSAWLFKRSGGSWVARPQLVSADPAAEDRFARSVALHGGTAVIGVPADDTAAGVDAGSAVALLVGPPLRPATKSPKGTVRGRRPVFRWNRAATALRYDVRVFKRGKVLLKKSGCTRLSWKASRALPRRVSLTWRVRAVNAFGAGPWSPARKFKIR